MNILFITYQGDIAGSTNSISYLAKGLAERGHNIYVGCRKESLLYSMLEETKVHLVPMTFKGRFDLKNIKQIRDCVVNNKIQIINAQSSWDRYTTVFARLIYGLNVKIFHTRRQTPKSVGGFFQNLIYVKGTDGIITVSNGVKFELEKLKVPPQHIYTIYNGTPKEKYLSINIEDVEYLKEKWKIKDNDFVIGTVSRLKDQDQILKALKFVNHALKVIFVGIDQNPHLKELGKYLEGKHEIIYTGIVSNKESVSFLKLFQIKILASTIEGLSQSILEAMALGVPVIATSAAGNLDLIKHYENGLLFQNNDINQLALHINKLMVDQELRTKLIEAGRKTALEDFSIEKTIINYENFFNKSL